MTREEFEYAIKSCGCLIHQGQTYYEESELIKAFEDLGLIHIGLEQQPCTDAVSRQAVLDAISEWKQGMNLYKLIRAIPSAEPTTDERKEALRELKQEYHHHQYNNSDSCYGWSTSFKQAVAVAIKCLSAEPKTGHWMEEDMFDGDVAYRCSECNELFWIESGTPKDNGYNFCPKCGKRLVEPQESEEV